MTNDTIDHDARVTRAAVVRPQRHAAVCADLDAAPMPIRGTLCLGANSRSAECKKYPARSERRRSIPTLRGGKHHHWTRWRESRLVSPGDGLPPAPHGARNGDDVMNEYEELVRSLVAERFTRWRPPTPISDRKEFNEHPLAHMDIPKTSATTRVRARIRKDETNTTARSER